jgi:phosphoserine phosphatase
MPSSFHVLIESENTSSFTSGPIRPNIATQHDEYTLLDYHSSEAYEPIKTICKQLWTQGKTAICLKTGGIKSAFFDMDSTVIGQECIVELARFAGSSDQVAKITEEAMQGQCSFNEALRARVATLKGQKVDIIARVSERLSLNPGMTELALLLAKKQCDMHLISGGFIELAGPIAQNLSFQSVHANTLVKVNGILTGHVEDPIVGAEAKRDYLLDICKNSGISPEDCMAIGDGANDYLMLENAGFAIGYNPKPVLFDVIDGAVFGDFKALATLIHSRDRG